jgi:hypothetical protein
MDKAWKDTVMETRLERDTLRAQKGVLEMELSKSREEVNRLNVNLNSGDSNISPSIEIGAQN